MSSPWANIGKLEPVKLEEIIAEEAAKHLQIKQENGRSVTTSEGITNGDSKSELNEEYDQLECVEEKCSNFRGLSLNIESDTEDEEIDDIWDEEDWKAPELACVSRNLFKGSKKVETAEYATVRGGKQSTCKLSSKVFNTLEVPLYNEEFRRYKVYRDKKKHPTTRYHLCIDQHAWHLIREMIKDKVILQVLGIKRFDEDSVMLRAVQYMPKLTSKLTFKISPQRCVIKVFKINLKLDKGFEIACQKAEKEVANTKRLMAAGIPCLPVIAHKEHVIVTSFYGTLLKNLYWFVDYYYGEYKKVRDLMKGFYEVNLIHPNLSENNIQYWWSSGYVILNVGQCVESSHEDAFHFLFKGCTNIVNFFIRRGVTDEEMPNPDDLFKYITGYSFLDKQSLSELQKSIKMKKN